MSKITIFVQHTTLKHVKLAGLEPIHLSENDPRPPMEVTPGAKGTGGGGGGQRSEISYIRILARGNEGETPMYTDLKTCMLLIYSLRFKKCTF